MSDWSEAKKRTLEKWRDSNEWWISPDPDLQDAIRALLEENERLKAERKQLGIRIEALEALARKVAEAVTI